MADNIVKSEKLGDEHAALHKVEHEIDHVEDLAKAKELFAEWMKIHPPHMSHEEKVLQPLTQKVGNTPMERALAYRNYVLKYVDASPTVSTEYDYMISYMVSMLAKHGSTSEKPVVAARVVIHALWVAATASQWNGHYRKICTDACPPELWQAIVEAVPELGELRLVSLCCTRLPM